VLDTVNRSLNGSESKDEDMAAYVQAADKLIAALNCAVVLVHHCGHEGTRPRGHSLLLGAVEAQIAVSRNAISDIVSELEFAKDGPSGVPIVSHLEQMEIGTDDDGDPLTSCIVIPVEGAVIEKAAPPKRTPNGARIALRALQDALADGGEPAPTSNHIPSNARVVSLKLWREYAYKRGISDGEDRAKQIAFKRASEYLISKSHVAKWDDHVWLVRKPQ
jgi:hypothetical protein